MKRRTASGQSALEQARSRARERAAEAHTSLVIESVAPAGQLLGAAAWLETRPGRREIDIVSDFQAGTLEESAIQALPADVGLRLDPIEALATAEPIEIQTRTGFTTTTARASLTPDRTSVEWRLETAPRSESAQLLQLAAPADSARIGAALEAALTSAPPPTDSAHRVAIVYPTHDARAQLMQDVDPVNRPWMGELAMALADDTLVTRVGRTTINGLEHLVLFSNAAPGSLASAETMASVLRALSPAVPVLELEPASIPIEVLRRWERAPPTVVDQTVRDDDASDGRWLWAVVLLLIGVETIVRRAPRKAAEPLTPEAAYDRVA